MEHFAIYHPQLPTILRQLAAAPAMQRLKDIGMNCGCEYTSFPRFVGCGRYSRYDHSLGAGLIVWHFTQDPAQAAAALLHDIATPVFAHVVDFLNGDYLTQESTESDTRAVIAASATLMQELAQAGLSVDAVCDYHRYPIADNDTPQLSADRLEYTIGNMLNYGFGDLSEARELYADLTVGENEQGTPELMFRTAHLAQKFARIALQCSKVYVSDEDRFAMEALAQLLKYALQRGVLRRDDLMQTEQAVIGKLMQDTQSKAAWKRYCACRTLLRSSTKPSDGQWYKVQAKKRHIDPLVQGEGRVSAIDTSFRDELAAFLSLPFDNWLSAREI